MNDLATASSAAASPRGAPVPVLPCFDDAAPAGDGGVEPIAGSESTAGGRVAVGRGKRKPFGEWTLLGLSIGVVLAAVGLAVLTRLGLPIGIGAVLAATTAGRGVVTGCRRLWTRRDTSAGMTVVTVVAVLA